MDFLSLKLLLGGLWLDGPVRECHRGSGLVGAGRLHNRPHGPQLSAALHTPGLSLLGSGVSLH